MPYETSHRFDSVCIIESLAPPFELTGTWLYNDVLKPLAEREHFLVRHYAAETRERLFDAFAHVKRDFLQQGHGPIIHIEAHGIDDHTGIVLVPAIPRAVPATARGARPRLGRLRPRLTSRR